MAEGEIDMATAMGAEMDEEFVDEEDEDEEEDK